MLIVLPVGFALISELLTQATKLILYKQRKARIFEPSLLIYWALSRGSFGTISPR